MSTVKKSQARIESACDCRKLRHDCLSRCGAGDMPALARMLRTQVAETVMCSLHDLRRSFCSLAGRRGVDPVEAAQITGHSPAVWAGFYARSFGKAQRDEARDRLLRYGFGAVSDDEAHGPLAPRSHGALSERSLPGEAESEDEETPANEKVPEGGAYRDRTGDLRLANTRLRGEVRSD